MDSRFDNRPVLLIEDDKVDAMTVMRAFDTIKAKSPLVHRFNGEEGLAYLHEEASPEPWLIFLDINMPRMSGIEFLKIMKEDASLRHIPVIVLTTSNEERDVIECFRFNVAGYILKPLDFKNFLETLETIINYWSLCELPAEQNSVAMQ